MYALLIIIINHLNNNLTSFVVLVVSP